MICVHTGMHHAIYFPLLNEKNLKRIQGVKQSGEQEMEREVFFFFFLLACYSEHEMSCVLFVGVFFFSFLLFLISGRMRRSGAAARVERRGMDECVYVCAQSEKGRCQ